MDETQTDRIRARAHEMWEQEGRVEGSANEHWTRAEAEILDIYGTGGPVDIHDPLHVSEASYQEDDTLRVSEASHQEHDEGVAGLNKDGGQHVPGSEHFPAPASKDGAPSRAKQAASVN